MDKRFDILGIGCVAVDDLLYVDDFPPADAKRRIRRSERQCGGLTGTALVAAARLGACCAFAGILGHDDLSKTVEDNFSKNGIDFSGAVRRDDARPVHSVIIVSEKTGSRNIFFDASAPTGADPNAPGEELILSASVLFLDYLGIEGGIRAATIARSAGIPIVADLEEDSDPRFSELLELVDHLVISHEFAAHLTGAHDPEEAARRLWNSGRNSVVVTYGDRGAWFLTVDQAGHQSAFQVQVVDTTGCGDVFHGAYAYALARGDGIADRVRYASAAAAVKATRSTTPTANEVRQLMSQ